MIRFPRQLLIDAPTIWQPALDGDPTCRRLFDRHYSRRRYADGRRPKLFVGPGEKLVLTTADRRALFVWRKFIDDAIPTQAGVNCAVFRREAGPVASEMILEAEQWAWRRWSGQRLYTYVNASRIRSTNPGYCFLCAGWSRCGRTKTGKTILEKYPERIPHD